MRTPRPRNANLNKITGAAILANSIQIICALALLFYAIFSDSFHIPEQAELALITVCSIIVIWGAAVDIRDAFVTRRLEQQRLMLQEAYLQLETLNTTLRRQRHDFKNHLQVVYTLIEMQAYDEVREYIQRIYEDVQSLGNLIKTSVPAVNALLSAKSSDCRQKGINFEVEIQSSWEEIPVAGWEMCRIIGNLVDNAMDALLEANSPVPHIRITISENIHSWNLRVENNGPEIPSSHKKNIFLPGFTTKSAGHGNGLNIVDELVKKYSGSLAMDSNADCTWFSCTFPRPETKLANHSV